jgi:ribosomal protein L37AE/L43A
MTLTQTTTEFIGWIDEQQFDRKNDTSVDVAKPGTVWIISDSEEVLRIYTINGRFAKAYTQREIELPDWDIDEEEPEYEEYNTFQSIEGAKQFLRLYKESIWICTINGCYWKGFNQENETCPDCNTKTLVKQQERVMSCRHCDWVGMYRDILPHNCPSCDSTELAYIVRISSFKPTKTIEEMIEYLL